MSENVVPQLAKVRLNMSVTVVRLLAKARMKYVGKCSARASYGAHEIFRQMWCHG